MDKNKVSVIIAAYNAEKYLRRCLDSVLNQPYQSIEALIMDDGSTDSTFTIAKEYASRDSRVRVFTQQNKGAAEARNRLIELSIGDYIAICDADDYNRQDRFVSQVDFLANHPDVDLVSGGMAKINSMGMVVFASKKRNTPGNDELILKEISNPIPHGGIMFRRSIVKKIDSPFYRKVVGEDIETLARLLYVGCHFAYQDGFCFYYQLGSSLQEDYLKNAIRDEQRRMLSLLVREGKILDHTESMQRYNEIAKQTKTHLLKKNIFTFKRTCYGIFANHIWNVWPRILRRWVYDFLFSCRAGKGVLCSYDEIEKINAEKLNYETHSMA